MSIARTARLLEATTPDAFANPRFDAFLESEEPLRAPTLERYWCDPDFARQQDAERAEWRRQTNALIDEGIRRAREHRAASKDSRHDD